MIAGLLAGLQEKGWTEGSNLAVERRYADGDGDKLSAVAAELVALNVDVIVTGSTPGALAAKRATSRIPVVFVTTGDPVAGGLVSSLHRPEANLTGVTALGVELAAKRLEVLKETFGAQRIAVLTHPGAQYTEEFLVRREEIARALSIDLEIVKVSDLASLDTAILRRDVVGGIIVLSDIMFITHQREVVEFVGRSGVPAIYPERGFIAAGGLLFYGAALRGMYRHAAAYVDKILRGARPSDLPVEQPTSFELVVNLRAARAAGLTIPPTLLARADEVIE
jgi:putative ABC transport system substrate-binding protein